MSVDDKRWLVVSDGASCYIADVIASTPRDAAGQGAAHMSGIIYGKNAWGTPTTQADVIVFDGHSLEHKGTFAVKAKYEAQGGQ